MYDGRLWQLHSKLLAGTPIINMSMFSVVGTTTLKVKFSVVGNFSVVVEEMYLRNQSIAGLFVNDAGHL